MSTQATPGARQLRLQLAARQGLSRYGIIIAFFVLCAVLSGLNEYFFTSRNIANVLRQASIDPKQIPTAGIDGGTEALLAVKRGEMVSILQDAHVQAQGALDVALRHLVGESYKPQSDCWQEYGAPMAWDGGMNKDYSVPWTPVTAQNVGALLAKRQKA